MRSGRVTTERANKNLYEKKPSDVTLRSHTREAVAVNCIPQHETVHIEKSSGFRLFFFHHLSEKPLKALKPSSVMCSLPCGSQPHFPCLLPPTHPCCSLKTLVCHTLSLPGAIKKPFWLKTNHGERDK